MKKIIGITLLEVVLILTVIATILMFTLRYFMTVSSNENVTRAVIQIQMLTKASYQWLQTQRQADFASGNAIDMTKLQQVGLINAENAVDPWGGSITLEPAADTNYVRISMNDVPEKACKNLHQRMNTIAHVQGDCTQGNNTYFIEL